MKTGEIFHNRGEMKYTTLPDITSQVLKGRQDNMPEEEISKFLKKRGWTTDRLTKAINKQTTKDEAMTEKQAQEGGGFWDTVNGGLEYFNKATDSILLGRTFGLSVPARAVGRYAKSKFVDDESISFSDAVDSVQDEDKEFSKENPNTAMATEMVGGMAGGADLVLKAGALAPVAGQTLMNFGKGAATQVPAGMVEGGGIAIAKDENAYFGAAAGLLGGLGGEVIAPAAKYLGDKIFTPIKNYFSKTPSKTISKAETKGEQLLEKMDNKDGITLKAKRQQLAEYEKNGLGDMVMGVDLQGEQGKNLAGTVLRYGDTVPDKAKKALTERAGKVRGRLKDFLHDATGGERVSLKETGENFRKSASKKSKESYNAAYYVDGVKKNGMLAIKDPRIDELFKLPDFQKAYQRAIDIAANAKPPYKLPPFPMKVEFMKNSQGKHILDELGKKIPIEKDAEWSVFALDKVKKALYTKYDGFIYSANDMVKAKGGDIISYKNDMLSYIEDSVPAYKKARDTYAGEMELKDAKELGEKLFDSGDSMDKIFEYSTKLKTESEKREFRNGAFNVLAKKIESSSKNPMGMTDYFLNEQNMHKLTMIIPDKEARDKFIKQTELLGGFVEVKNRLVGGSQSLEKAAADATEADLSEGTKFIGKAARRDFAGMAEQAQGFGQQSARGERLDVAGDKIYRQETPSIYMDQNDSLLTNQALKKGMRGQSILSGGAGGAGTSLINSLLQ